MTAKTHLKRILFQIRRFLLASHTFSGSDHDENMNLLFPEKNGVVHHEAGSERP